ncbi:platelet-activating factor acetylhydrolase, isoform II-domain-containing protein [Trichophaea hybrida]|nr:platelet-activating factor acetylhydrolase, isoform II-domain-containing protein [Trichophaea hybrida]
MSFLSRLNVIPQFPAYKGPYTVASFELEIPVSSLPATQKPPKSAESISTVQFRIFYPTGQHFTPADPRNATTATPPSGDAAGAEAKGWTSGWFRQRHPCSPPSKSVYWLPEPHQREYLGGYARFLGAGSGLAELISYIPRILHHIALPAISLVPLIPSNSDFKFPTIIFSHGLGGTRLAYSHLCGSLASYGNIVIAPEHRDGSAPVTFIKPGSKPEAKVKGPKPGSDEPGISSCSAAPSPSRVQVDYTNYPHQISDETANGRNRQLEVRLWELSVVYAALTQLDLGHIPAGTSMFDADTTSRDSLLSAFREKFDIREPGRLIWVGHSFGSATMIQMMKSVYYGKRGVTSNPEEAPLFIPDTTIPHNTPGAVPLGDQITASSPLMLLDIWCLPLLSKRTRPLWKLPLPQIDAGNTDKVLVIMSDEFFRWRENLRGVRRVLSTDPGRRREGPEHKVFEQWDSRPNTASKEFHPNNDVSTPGGANTGNQIVPPINTSSTPPSPPETDTKETEGIRFYYVKDSAHLSQSDFGLLFPRAMKRAVEPELILDLNVRAACQWLRECGYGGQLAEYERKDAGGLDEKLEKMQIGEKEGDDVFGGKTERWVRISLED